MRDRKSDFRTVETSFPFKVLNGVDDIENGDGAPERVNPGTLDR